jgi:CheY-like chemotaxis protein
MRIVLVADDNAISRELIREILVSENYRVVEVENGAQALDKTAEVRPDLILLDIQMPVMDGFAVIGQLRRDQRFLRIPVVALTASAMQDDRERALAAGFDEYITKPIRAASLRAHIKRLLRVEDTAAQGA